MMMFLRNSCSQNSHQQIFKRTADQPLSSALRADRSHDTTLLSQTAVSWSCLGFWETLNIPKYNLKVFTHIIISFPPTFWKIPAKLLPNTKLRNADHFWQRQNTLQLFFHFGERAWTVVKHRCRAVGKVWGESPQRVFSLPHKPRAAEKQQRRHSKTIVHTWSADALAVKFRNTLGVLRLEPSGITQTISTINFFRLTAELWEYRLSGFAMNHWNNLEE